KTSVGCTLLLVSSFFRKEPGSSVKLTGSSFGVECFVLATCSVGISLFCNKNRPIPNTRRTDATIDQRVSTYNLLIFSYDAFGFICPLIFFQTSAEGSK